MVESTVEQHSLRSKWSGTCHVPCGKINIHDELRRDYFYGDFLISGRIAISTRLRTITKCIQSPSLCLVHIETELGKSRPVVRAKPIVRMCMSSAMGDSLFATIDRFQ